MGGWVDGQMNDGQVYSRWVSVSIDGQMGGWSVSKDNGCTYGCMSRWRVGKVGI